MALKRRNAFLDDPLWEAFVEAIPPGMARAQAWSAAVYAFILLGGEDRFNLLAGAAEWLRAPEKGRGAVQKLHLGCLAEALKPHALAAGLGPDPETQDAKINQILELATVIYHRTKTLWPLERRKPGRKRRGEDRSKMPDERRAQPPQTETADSRKTPDQR